MRTTTKKRRGKPDPAILADIVERIVEAAQPEKIVLFGSAARGTMGPDSDYDLLVIKMGKFDHNRVATAIYRNMNGEAPVDAVVVSCEEAERYRHTHCLVVCPALREGRVVYEARTPAAGRSSRMDTQGKKQPRSRPADSTGRRHGNRLTCRSSKNCGENKRTSRKTEVPPPLFPNAQHDPTTDQE
jgi:uncharacterized protein